MELAHALKMELIVNIPVGVFAPEQELGQWLVLRWELVGELQSPGLKAAASSSPVIFVVAVWGLSWTLLVRHLQHLYWSA